MSNNQNQDLIKNLQQRIQGYKLGIKELPFLEQFDSLLKHTRNDIKTNAKIELRDYEKYLHELVNFANETLKNIVSLSGDKTDYYLSYIDELKQDIQDTTNEYSFDTVYYLSIFTRRTNKAYHFQDIVDDYKVDQSKKNYFTHIKNIYYLETRIPSENFKDILKDTVEIFKAEIKKKTEINTGIIHCVADTLISIYEECVLQHNYEFLEDNRLQFKRNSILTKVMKELKDIISNQEKTNTMYAKFFCTYARFQSCDNDLKQSSVNFQKALAFEDKKHIHYTDRISYIREKRQISNLVLNQRKSYESLSKIQENTQELSDKISNSLMKNLEFMGLFAGLIGFMIVSINLAANVEYGYTLFLIAVSFLSIIVTFTTIDIVISNKSIKKHYISYIVLVIAISLIATTILISKP